MKQLYSRSCISIALYEPEMPQNVGNILRTCAGFNCTLYIIHPIGFVWDDKLLKRAQLDYTTHVIHLNSFNELENATQGLRIVATGTKGAVDCFQMHYQQGDILLFGKESTGLANLNEYALSVKIPIVTRSLNLAVSVGIIGSYATHYLQTNKT